MKKINSEFYKKYRINSINIFLLKQNDIVIQDVKYSY